MNDAQFAAERRRHPDSLATELITLRRKCRALEIALKARTTLSNWLPDEYADAILFANDVAHHAPVTEHETPGRAHPESTEPSRNPEALRLLKVEHRALLIRATNLHSASAWAAEHPEGTRRTA